MASLADLDINLPWVVPVKAIEGLAVVAVDSAVGHVQGIQRCGESLAEVLTDLPTERSRVVCCGKWSPGYGCPGKDIAEARAVIDVGRREPTPRKTDVAAKIESVSQVVIERKKGKSATEADNHVHRVDARQSAEP